MVEAGIAVKALLQGATTERKQEIEDLWDHYAPKVRVVADARGVNISAGKGRIQFDHKTLEAIWLLGFNGWRSIETYSPAIILAGITGALEQIGNLGPRHVAPHPAIRLQDRVDAVPQFATDDRRVFGQVLL